jgi:hypothetical protein
MLQTLNNRSLTEPVPSIPEGFEMTVWLVFGQALHIYRYKVFVRLMTVSGTLCRNGSMHACMVKLDRGRRTQGRGV